MEKCFSLSKKQISRLEDILPRPRRKIDLEGLVLELEKVGTRYKKVVKRLGVLPALETWDRGLVDREFMDALLDDERKRTERQLNARSNRVAKADHELARLCTDIATIWKRWTKRALPGWPKPKAREAFSRRRAVDSQHPLGLMLDALHIYVAAASVDDLAELGRRRSKEAQNAGERK